MKSAWQTNPLSRMDFAQMVGLGLGLGLGLGFVYGCEAGLGLRLALGDRAGPNKRL